MILSGEIREVLVGREDDLEDGNETAAVTAAAMVLCRRRRRRDREEQCVIFYGVVDGVKSEA